MYMYIFIYACVHQFLSSPNAIFSGLVWFNFILLEIENKIQIIKLDFAGQCPFSHCFPSIVVAPTAIVICISFVCIFCFYDKHFWSLLVAFYLLLIQSTYFAGFLYITASNDLFSFSFSTSFLLLLIEVFIFSCLNNW